MVTSTNLPTRAGNSRFADQPFEALTKAQHLQMTSSGRFTLGTGGKRFLAIQSCRCLDLDHPLPLSFRANKTGNEHGLPEENKKTRLKESTSQKSSHDLRPPTFGFHKVANLRPQTSDLQAVTAGYCAHVSRLGVGHLAHLLRHQDLWHLI